MIMACCSYLLFPLSCLLVLFFLLCLIFLQHYLLCNTMSTFCQTSGIRGPTSGCKGTVVLTFEDNPTSKIGVRFDAPVPDGVDFAGLCDRSHGYFCHGNICYLIDFISFHLYSL